MVIDTDTDKIVDECSSKDEAIDMAGKTVEMEDLTDGKESSTD